MQEQLATAARPVREMISEFRDLRTWALVGFSKDPTKYGNRIYHSLTGAGYKIYPVNPKGGTYEFDGAQIYPTLKDLPEAPDVVDIVVPPRITEGVIREAAELGLRRIWIQPGAASEDAVRYAQEEGIEVVYGGPCAMVHKRFWN